MVSGEMWVCSSKQVACAGWIKGGVLLSLTSTEDSYRLVAHVGHGYFRVAAYSNVVAGYISAVLT